jgi:hypothetical protein
MLNRFGSLMMTAAAAALAISTIACGGDKHTIDSPDEPEWVTKGGGAFSGESNKVFYGVGAVSGVRNKALARQTSDQRARADIARIFETYVAALMKDYARSTTAGDMSASSEEQDIQNTIKTFTKMTLRGVQIVDHWRDPSDGTLYALASLDLEGFKGQLAQMNELDSKVRDFVRANAEKAFDELSAEEAKHE